MYDKLPLDRDTGVTRMRNTFQDYDDLVKRAWSEMKSVGIKPDDLDKYLSKIDINSNFILFMNKNLYTSIFMILRSKFGKDLNSTFPSYQIIDGAYLNDIWFNGEGAPEEMRYKYFSDLKLVSVFLGDSNYSHKNYCNILHDLISSRSKDRNITWVFINEDINKFKSLEGDLSMFDNCYNINFAGKTTKSANKNTSSSHFIGKAK